jgi:glycosyltransferase involved in cell wall biosynthesis
MKINFILANADMSGGIRVIATQAKELAARGHDVRAFSTPLPPPSFRKSVRRFLKGKGWPKPGPSERRPSFFDNSPVPHTVIPKFRPITDRDLPDADVSIATWWQTADWVWRLSPSKGAKAFFIQHYESWAGNPRAVDKAWRLPMHKIVISRWLEKIAREQFNDQTVSYVPNSVDMSLFNAPPRPKNKIPTLGFLYSTIWFKGPGVALKAIEQVRKEFPELQVVSFGHHPAKDYYPLPPGTKYTVLPPQPTIKDIYSQCDVWICASRSEGFYLPMLEAMACRCPVVSTRVGGPIDTIVEGENGFLVDVEDHDALAQRLIEVLRLSADRWQKMSDAAYATACRYTWQDAAALMEAALERAIEGSRRRHRIGA